MMLNQPMKLHNYRAVDKEGVFGDNKEYFFFLILIKNICCDPSPELMRWLRWEVTTYGLMRNKKNYHQILPLIESSDNTPWLYSTVDLLYNEGIGSQTS